MEEWMTLIVSNLMTGSLSWFFTLRSSRRMAAADAADHEATATEHVQTIYKTLVADLVEEKRQLKKEVDLLKSEIGTLRREVRSMERSLTDMEKKVERESLFCAIAETCRNCVPVMAGKLQGKTTEIIKTS